MTYCTMVLLVVSTASCKSKMNGTPEETFGKQSYYRTVSEGSNSNIDKREVRIITSGEELQEIFAKINSTRKPGIEIPEVDWKSQTIIAAFLGKKSTAGYGLQIVQVRDNEESRVYKFSETAPSSGEDVVSMVITSPYMIVVVENNDKKITASF